MVEYKKDKPELKEAVKYDGDKLRYDLIPAYPLEQLAKLYMVGAKKYTGLSIPFKDIPEWIIRNLNCQNAVVINAYTHSDFVAGATNKIYLDEILSMQKDKEKTQGDGVNEIQKKLKCYTVVEYPTQHVGKEIENQNKLGGYENSGILLNLSKNYLNSKMENALSVEKNFQKEYSISITIITQDKLEVSFVAGATTGLECLEIISKELHKRFNTSLPTQDVARSGDRNWEKGMKYGRIFAAMLRHAYAWWQGETNDSESKVHHMAAVAWGAFAIIEYEKTGKGEDDRPNVAVQPHLSFACDNCLRRSNTCSNAGCINCAPMPIEGDKPKIESGYVPVDRNMVGVTSGYETKTYRGSSIGRSCFVDLQEAIDHAHHCIKQKLVSRVEIWDVEKATCIWTKENVKEG